MTFSVSSDTPAFIFDEEFENFRDVLKEETQVSLENTAAQTKIILQGSVDGSAKTVATSVTAPSKAGVEGASPAPIATSVNTVIISGSVESSIESTIKKTGQKSIDKCVDTTAKKVIDEGIDRSVNGSKSGWNVSYSYFQGSSTC
jgi:hypothetical protein